MMKGAAICEKDDEVRGADFGLLPRSVRFVGANGGASVGGLCEFEVVSGNAAYREGERFYLTPAKAQKAYPTALLT
jgi:hypothetical protein